MKTPIIKTLIILAGGKSTRFGAIGALIPKSLLPIYETSLLQKQIEEAFASGIKRVIVSTHPTFESIMTKLIKHKDRGVIIVSNTLHAHSSFAALAYVIREMHISESIFVSLADIYFLSDPFQNTIQITENKTCLFLAEPFHKNELMRGVRLKYEF
jgi:NDP-sugar pyrophosphorylase family protein